MKDLKPLFLPYELAKIAKEKGFNEPCMTFYDDKHIEHDVIDPFDCEELGWLPNSKIHKELVAAPLYQQIVDWFREEYNTQIYIEPIRDSNYPKKTKNYKLNIVNAKGQYLYEVSPTYLEALDKAIEEVFKLI